MNGACRSRTLRAHGGQVVAETPEWKFGGRAQLNLGPITIGAQAKWVDSAGPRTTTRSWSTITPWSMSTSGWTSARSGCPTPTCSSTSSNLFGESYFGNLSTQIQAGGNPNFSIGAPQTFMVTLNLAWSRPLIAD